MGDLHAYTLTAILIQTVISVLVAWWTLACKFTPDHSELRELTLMKLLYLYDPESCGRVYFYNQTGIGADKTYTTLIWPLENPIAAAFRNKIKFWVSLHILWLIIYVLNLGVGQKACAVYVTLVPFALVGIAILCLDLAHAAIFIVDALKTQTEADILNYIKSPTSTSNVYVQKKDLQDTSWIALLMAYCSLRGVAMWFINFWFIKDNYFEGLAFHQVPQIVTVAQNMTDTSSRLGY